MTQPLPLGNSATRGELHAHLHSGLASQSSICATRTARAATWPGGGGRGSERRRAAGATGLSRAEVVLLDWNLAGAAAAGLLPALRRDCPDRGVIVLSGRPEAREAALAAGADTFVSKGNPPEHLLAAIARYYPDGETATPPLCCIG